MYFVRLSLVLLLAVAASVQTAAGRVMTDDLDLEAGFSPISTIARANDALSDAIDDNEDDELIDEVAFNDIENDDDNDDDDNEALYEAFSTPAQHRQNQVQMRRPQAAERRRVANQTPLRISETQHEQLLKDQFIQAILRTHQQRLRRQEQQHRQQMQRLRNQFTQQAQYRRRLNMKRNRNQQQQNLNKRIRNQNKRVNQKRGVKRVIKIKV